MRGRPGCVVYVSELPSDVRRGEIEDLFYKYGRIKDVDVKGGNRQTAFAFIEFDHPRDAEDAVRGRDGRDFDGRRLRVELAKGTKGPPSAPTNWRNKGTGCRILVEDLPKSASWQDLKDMFREVAKPVYTNVYRDDRGVFGVVEYDTHHDVREVMRSLRGAKFKNPWEECVVHLVDDTDDSKRDREDDRRRSRSRSASPRRDRSASPRRDRSPSIRRDRSPSPGRDRSPSADRRSP